MGGAEKSTIEISNYLNDRYTSINNYFIVFSKNYSKQLNLDELDYICIDDLNIVKNLTTIIRFLKIKEINVIHAHFIKCSIICSILKLLFYNKISFVVTEHSLINLHKINIFKIILYKTALLNADKIIAVSNLSFSYINSHINYLKDKIIIINNFINFENYNLYKREIKRNDYIKFLIVSRLTVDKNLIESINFCLFMSKYCKVHLDILGDGPIKSQLYYHLNLVKNLNFTYTFHGNQININIFLKNSDFLINFSKVESFSLTTLESLATGLPVICYNSDFINLFNYNDAPIIASPINSYYELRDRINYYINNDKSYSYRDYLILNYDIKYSASKLFQMYKFLKEKNE